VVLAQLSPSCGRACAWRALPDWAPGQVHERTRTNVNAVGGVCVQIVACSGNIPCQPFTGGTLVGVAVPDL